MKTQLALIITLAALQACQPSDLSASAAKSSGERVLDASMINNEPAEYCIDNVVAYPGLACTKVWIDGTNGFQVGQYCTTGNALEDLTLSREMAWDARETVGISGSINEAGEAVNKMDRVSFNAGGRAWPAAYRPQDIPNAIRAVPGYQNGEGEMLVGIFINVSDKKVSLTDTCQK